MGVASFAAAFGFPHGRLEIARARAARLIVLRRVRAENATDGAQRAIVVAIQQGRRPRRKAGSQARMQKSAASVLLPEAKASVEDFFRRGADGGTRFRKAQAKAGRRWTALCMTALRPLTTKQNTTVAPVSVRDYAGQFVDNLQLVAYSGARRNKALGLRWEDLDFANGQ